MQDPFRALSSTMVYGVWAQIRNASVTAEKDFVKHMFLIQHAVASFAHVSELAGAGEPL